MRKSVVCLLQFCPTLSFPAFGASSRLSQFRARKAHRHTQSQLFKPDNGRTALIFLLKNAPNNVGRPLSHKNIDLKK